jgi:hypothetical protein
MTAQLVASLAVLSSTELVRRQQNVVMGTERPGPKTDCNANYRSVFSSGRAINIRMEIFRNQEKNIIMWHGP